MTREKLKNIFNAVGSAVMISSAFAGACAVAVPTVTAVVVTSSLFISGVSLMTSALQIQNQQEKVKRAESGYKNRRVTKNQDTRLPAYQTSLP